MRISPAAVTGRLDALEKRGYIRRLPQVGDRRKVLVELTETGRSAWHEAIKDRGDEEHRIFAALDRVERHRLANLLRRLLLVVEADPAS